jgi:hypothetical protein
VFGKEPPESVEPFSTRTSSRPPTWALPRKEAQEKVAIELAEVFVGFLKDGIVKNAVK